ncbi:MAG: peptidoglycan DD-metalloendopeptidase family protein [Christensenellales bacterium]
MMRKIPFLLLIALLPCLTFVRAETTFTATGAWSDWSENAPSDAEGLEIETRDFSGMEDVLLYRYRRFIFYNMRCEMWCSTYTDEIDSSLVEEGSGYWEETSCESPKGVLNVDDAYIAYEGGWYHEAETVESVYREYRKYRWRAVRQVPCAFSRREAVLNIGERIDLPCLGDTSDISFLSTDEAVATVSERGRVAGKGAGRAKICIVHGGEIWDACEIEVSQKGALISGGPYTASLCAGGFLFGTGKPEPVSGDALMLFAGLAKRGSRFSVEIVEPGTFFLVSFADDSLAYRAMEDGTVALQKLDRQTTDPAFYWRCMKNADESYRFYPKGRPDVAIGFSESVIGETARLQDAEPNSALQKWTLSKIAEGGFAADAVLPIPTDGSCYVTSEFGVQRTETHMHEGIDIGSFGKRVNCFAASSGRVVKIRTACRHDYAKTTMRNGRYVDPCGNTAGNYVIIDHGNNLMTAYMHLSRVDVKVGQVVKAGEIIGKTGSTGSSGGVHLHFGVLFHGEYVNPRNYFDFPGIGVLIK